jgi:hypothetical protein
MNDLNEMYRRDFSRTKNLIDEFHLLNWSTDWTFWSSIESNSCLSRSWKDENRCLIDSKDRCLIDSKDRCLIDWENDDCCLIDCEDEDRCLIDNFSLFRDWSKDFVYVDCSRSDDCRADSDFCDSDRDCVCHE